MSSSAWFGAARTRSAVDLRLLCLPYAGGGVAAYRDWRDLVPPEIDVLPVRLPGRDGRFREPAFDRMTSLVSALVPPVLERLDRPFAVVGHSMGALVGFELCRALEARGNVAVLLSVGACPSPRRSRPTSHLAELPDQQFLSAVSATTGRHLDASSELVQLMLPAMRADVRLCETYRYQPGPRLRTPILGLVGESDRGVNADDLGGWQEETAADCHTASIPGGHFFLETAALPVVEALQASLTRQHRAP